MPWLASSTPGIDRDEAEATYIANLRHAADAAAKHGITVLAEPINTRDMPGYFLNTSTMARKILAAVSRPNLKLQFDIYHTQIMEGDLSERLRQNLEAIGHIQIAGISRPARTGCGGDQLSLSVPADRRRRLWRLDRLRVPAEGEHSGGAWLGEGIWDHRRLIRPSVT